MDTTTKHLRKCRWCDKDVDSRVWVNGLHRECDEECRGVRKKVNFTICPTCNVEKAILAGSVECITCHWKRGGWVEPVGFGR